MNSYFIENQLHFIATGHKSLVTLHTLTEFLESDDPYTIVHNTDKKKEALTQLALLNRNITGMHGLGALSFAHAKEDMSLVQHTLEEIAPHISKRDSN